MTVCLAPPDAVVRVEALRALATVLADSEVDPDDPGAAPYRAAWGAALAVTGVVLAALVEGTADPCALRRLLAQHAREAAAQAETVRHLDLSASALVEDGDDLAALWHRAARLAVDAALWWPRCSACASNPPTSDALDALLDEQADP